VTTFHQHALDAATAGRPPAPPEADEAVTDQPAEAATAETAEACLDPLLRTA